MQEILSKQDIEKKINRLAFQLLENCFEEQSLFLGGIVGNGIVIANRIAKIIQSNSKVNVIVFEIKINKSEPWAEKTVLTANKEDLKNGYIVLIDDVLNSGKTMQYALMEILQFPTKAIKTLTLVDRTHRRFPIKADFVGLSLSTTLKNRVEVILSEKDEKAYLV
ncbi:MAG: phosphoribosyltransferase family protein [Crocinitomicaceae bacterium]|jgi:pyrimidine operon attenuation protein / uracil phosphoribosyltransferase|nr:phosphoribosyltransferase family protein [Crocinitomicaceae bacterium]MDP5098761.1 phosphoribosyltransferase family protein [Crocinitomicaceae bacterium]